jgi:hypothetical protein
VFAGPGDARSIALVRRPALAYRANGFSKKCGYSKGGDNQNENS